jgi:hypothetical protein
MSFNRSAFLTPATELAMLPVEVPGMGEFFVREMLAGERDAFEAGHVKAGGGDFRARLVVFTACSETGARYFAESDIPALSALPAARLQAVADAATKVNRLGDTDVEDLRKNS